MSIAALDESIDRHDFAAAARSVVPVWLGRIGYAPAWELQREVFDEVSSGARASTFLLCEHPDVITLGRNCNGDENLRASRAELEADGYEIFDVDRGGDVTYHGPGQLVGYPIVRLADFREDLGWYMRSIEEMIICTLGELGVSSTRKEGLSGVWCGDGKVCAIGVRASRWVTMHGFAFNVTTDLDRFAAIVPCGIDDHAVTSIEHESGTRYALDDVALKVAQHWDAVFAP